MIIQYINMMPIYENYRSGTPVYFHYAMGSKNYEISLFGLKLLATTVYMQIFVQKASYCCQDVKMIFLM